MPKQKAQAEKIFAVSGLLYGAICWGLIWYPYRLLNEIGIAGAPASFYSYLIAIAIGCLLYFRRYRQISKIPRSAYWLCLIAGWTNLSYVLAVIDGEVMRVMLLFYLSPLWTLLLARVWLKERWQPPQLLAIALSLLGAWLMLTEAKPVFPLPQSSSDWLALSAGIGFSMTNVMTRFSTHLSIAAKSMLVWVGVALMSVAVMAWQQTLHAFPQTLSLLQPATLGLLLLVAMMLVTATVFVQYGVTKIPAIQASVLFMFELIVAAIAAYVLAHEQMSLAELLGGLSIVLAGLVSVMAPAAQEPSSSGKAVSSHSGVSNNSR